MPDFNPKVRPFNKNHEVLDYLAFDYGLMLEDIKKLRPKLYKRIVDKEYQKVDVGMDNYESEHYGKIFGNFPILREIDNIKEVKNKSGFVLILDISEMEGLELTEWTKKYRKSLKQIEYIIILKDIYSEYEEKGKNFDNEYFHKFHFDKYTNIDIVDLDIFAQVNMDCFEALYELYINYLKNITTNKKITSKKAQKLEKIAKRLKKRDFNTQELSKYTNISVRDIQRYMHDMKYINVMVGYNKKTEKWYIISK